MALVSYIAGFLTIPAIVLIVRFVGWAFRRDVGYGPCRHCRHFGGTRGVEIGEVFHINYWLQSMIHRFIWARTRRHRLSRGLEWRERDAKGYMNNQWNKKYML